MAHECFKICNHRKLEILLLNYVNYDDSSNVYNFILVSERLQAMLSFQLTEI